MEESIYGSNAIVGNNVTPAPVGRDVDIQTSNTQTITLNTGGQPQGEPQGQPQGEPNAQPQADPTKTVEQIVDPEATLTKEIQQAQQADKDIQADLTAKGVDFNTLATEYEKTGVLSAESLAQLEKAGYPRSAVNAYIAGMDATTAKFENTVYEYAGGKEEYARMAQFISSMGQNYVQAFDRAVDSGDLTQIRMAITGFKAQMTQKYGTNNRNILGGNATNTGVQGFANKGEMTAAMRDARYGRDPGYTKEVQNKVIAASFMK